VSQYATIKAVRITSLDVILTVKQAVRGMAKILGVYNDMLVIADSGQLSFWDKRTLAYCDRFDFPTGSYNKGALLCGNKLFGSDNQSIYSMVID
jgi:hypothetical protein